MTKEDIINLTNKVGAIMQCRPPDEPTLITMDRDALVDALYKAIKEYGDTKYKWGFDAGVYDTLY